MPWYWPHVDNPQRAKLARVNGTGLKVPCMGSCSLVPSYQDWELSTTDGLRETGSPWFSPSYFFWIAGRNGERRCLVHDKSLSDKALQNFAADMHALGKDTLVNEVRQVQSQVAVLNVSYGDWWLVLPDRRMILSRYESVIGLLGWKKSDFSAQECTDYQANNGGCVGRSSRPM